MLVTIEARILIFPGTDFHLPSTSVPPGTFFRLWLLFSLGTPGDCGGYVIHIYLKKWAAINFPCVHLLLLRFTDFFQAAGTASGL